MNVVTTNRRMGQRLVIQFSTEEGVTERVYVELCEMWRDDAKLRVTAPGGVMIFREEMQNENHARIAANESDWQERSDAWDEEDYDVA